MKTILKRSPSSAGHKAQPTVLPSKQELQHCTDESDEDDQNDYDYPDISKMNIEPCTKPNIKKHIGELPRYSQNPVKSRSHLDSAIEGKAFDKPVCKIVPSVRPADRNYDAHIPLSSMSVEQVYTCFVECGLPELATKCKNEKLDGKFISTYDDIEFKKVFSLNDLHAKKFEGIKKGWRPKKN